jgi:hypothetical protein
MDASADEVGRVGFHPDELRTMAEHVVREAHGRLSSHAVLCVLLHAVLVEVGQSGYATPPGKCERCGATFWTEVDVRGHGCGGAG